MKSKNYNYEYREVPTKGRHLFTKFIYEGREYIIENRFKLRDRRYLDCRPLNPNFKGEMMALEISDKIFVKVKQYIKNYEERKR